MSRRKKRQRATRYKHEVPDFPPEMLERLRMPHDYVLRDGKPIFTEKGAAEAKRLLEPFSAVGHGVPGEPAPAFKPLPPSEAISAHETTAAESISAPPEGAQPEQSRAATPVDLTRDGAEAARQAHNLKVEGSSPSPATPIEMAVSSIPQNDYLVMAKAPGDTTERRVWVGDHENFVVGMKLKALPHPVHAGVWNLHGGLPRMKGRW